MSCCTTWPREGDPELHDFYARELLEPGWAGELSRVELAYIKSQLQRSASLRRKWGFRPSAKRLSEARIRMIAMHGVSGNSRGVLASVGRDKRGGTMEEARAVAGPGSPDRKSALPGRQEGKKRQSLEPATSSAVDQSTEEHGRQMVPAGNRLRLLAMNKRR